MNSWRTTTVGQMVKEGIISQPTDGNHGEIHPKGADFITTGIPFVMASDINNGAIDLTRCKFISRKQAESLRKGFAIEGDVLLTHKATIGRTAIVPKIATPYVMLTPQVTYYRVINKEVLNNEYLRYYFDFAPFQESISLLAGAGSTRAYIGILGQHNLRVSFPESLTVQRKIAAVLATLDAKIDCNNRINAELEAMAKTLYDYWFVQFDFPDANGKPYKSSGGKMIYNEALKREIPNGWKDGSLWNIARYFNGLPMQKYRPTGNEFLPVIKIKEMGEGVSTDSEKASPNIPKDAVVEDGDVLFSWSATLDVKIWTQGLGALNQHIFKVTSDRYPKTFYYFELLAYLSHFKMMAEKRKTTMGHITQDHLKQSKICIPPLPLLSDAQLVLDPILNKKIFLDKENQQLAKLRDWLLPLLMNGQVSVK
jgi:type I restriction enzyme, S subunit